MAVVRKRLLQIALKRPGVGTSLELLHKRSAMIQWPDLREILQGIHWAAIGGVASRKYMPERATVDLDILVRAKDAQSLRERLQQAGYKYLQELTAGGPAWRSTEGVEIDILESDEPWVSIALEQAQNNPDLQGLLILPLSYLVLLKFRAGRVQDLADITRMLGLAGESDLDQVRQVFRAFEPDGIEDLDSMILLGRMECGP